MRIADIPMDPVAIGEPGIGGYRRARALHRVARVALPAALLTLILPAAAAPGGLDLTESIERIPLPAPFTVSVRVEPLAQRVAVGTPAPAALERKLRATSHELCPEVSREGGEVVLHCTVREIAAGLVPYAGGQFLELRRLAVPPWSGRDALPIVPFDPQRIGLGSHCPGTGNAAVAECALVAGHWGIAQQSLRSELAGPHADLAALRLGDLAAREGNLSEAVSLWKRVSHTTAYGRLAGARLCEVDPRCLGSPRAAILFAPGDMPDALREDLVLHRARLDAFQGRTLEAAQALAAERGPIGACSAEPTLCADVLLAALREPGARGLQALSLYLETPSRDRGPLVVELARAASDQAAATGAPVFAANLLATTSGEVPAARLSDHLARATELYLSGGDRVRATVLLDFARSRLPKAELQSPRWARIAHEMSAKPAAAPLAPTIAETEKAEEELRVARKALSSLPARESRGTP